MFISGKININRIRLTVFMIKAVTTRKVRQKPVETRKNPEMILSDENNVLLQRIPVFINAVKPEPYTAGCVCRDIQEW